MLELLPCLLFIRICDSFLIDFCHIREPIHDESPQKHGVGHFIIFNRKGGETLQCLQLGNLDETIDIVVLEQQLLEIDKTFQFRNVRWTYDAVKANILERYLHHRLLELLIVEDFESISIDEQKLVTFDFGVT